MPIKPVLKVWCLPSMSEEALNALHKDLVAASVSVEKLNLKGEEDLIVLFPADQMQYGLGSVVLLEYSDPEAYWKRYGVFEQLASNLGNAAKRHLPNAKFIQCLAATLDSRTRGEWTSEQYTTREEVEKIHAAAIKLFPHFKQEASKHCYCEANAIDFKGACSHHNVLAQYKWAVDQGRVVLDTKGPVEFQELADVYVAACKDPTWFKAIYDELGWSEKPSEAA